MKICTKCALNKELSEFGKDSKSKDGLKYACRKCTNAYLKALRSANLEKFKEKQRIWYQNNKEIAKGIAVAWQEANRGQFESTNKKWKIANKDRCKGNWLKRKYWPTLTWSEALAKYQALSAAQNDTCPVCTKHRSQFTKDLCVDHNHLTGVVRGLLCHGCNQALGLLQTDSGTDYLVRALTYINPIR